MKLKSLFGFLLILFAIFLGLSFFGILTIFQLSTPVLTVTAGILAIILGIVMLSSKKPSA
jgi:small neutral amino acid transporter SnatA (MarC family)